MTQTDDVVRLVHHVLGVEVVGVYPHGSAVLGGLRPRSDIDVLAVVRRRLTARQRRALLDGALALSGSGEPGRSARPVELTVAVHGDVRPWRYPPVCEFQYGEWLRDSCLRGEVPSRAPSADLAPLITMVLLGRVSLAGPPPWEVLNPVPRRDLEHAMLSGVPELLAELMSDTRNALLTLARIWMTLTTGEIGSKDAAADWALPRLPAEHRAVLAHARAVYLGLEPERWEPLLARVRPCAGQVVRALERPAAAHGVRLPPG
ncbi:aminoglycoside adenylyltransferase family protein [Streptomyces katsurahamanus]|uniref:DUF4111 domain-containing protein n=1 Tax=Streptomyces katsurahamanus TaxID=2577098 RepID=A0ABW9NRA8_9ACTN|nr:aminoglycoside adenylyltransferase family protein [Streptomyces katsurahamanus]MQS35850.1 DUF4111 domain-containing protein [Streptomyces katsurahamanus]